MNAINVFAGFIVCLLLGMFALANSEWAIAIAIGIAAAIVLEFIPKRGGRQSTN